MLPIVIADKRGPRTVGSLVCTLEVGRLTHFERNLRHFSMMKQSTTCGLLYELGGAQKEGRGKQPNFSSKLTHREFYFTAVYKRNGGARDQEYLRGNSS